MYRPIFVLKNNIYFSRDSFRGLLIFVAFLKFSFNPIGFFILTGRNLSKDELILWKIYQCRIILLVFKRCWYFYENFSCFNKTNYSVLWTKECLLSRIQIIISLHLLLSNCLTHSYGNKLASSIVLLHFSEAQRFIPTIRGNNSNDIEIERIICNFTSYELFFPLFLNISIWSDRQIHGFSRKKKRQKHGKIMFSNWNCYLVNSATCFILFNGWRRLNEPLGILKFFHL